MCIVPVIQSFVDLDKLAKCAELRNRQHGGWITQHVAKTTNNIISSLDKKDTEIGKSLQNLLMDIPSSTGNKTSRYSFQSISPGKVAATSFHFIPIKTTEASMAIKGLYVARTAIRSLRGAPASTNRAKWASLLIMAVWDFTWTLWDHRNGVLHNLDVHDQLLDMDAIDLAIIKEWHAGGEELIPMDRMQCWKGIDLETLLAKRS
jgi:hypothetical protein